jgi:3-deoxy-manno-octulosonate cytidylyltransferase (CMP-KDO synthetase)
MTGRAVVVIPARYASTRLPGKPLLKAFGKTLIEHVWSRARLATRAAQVIVATDDERIAETVRGFGGEARMTSSQARTGSDRIAELLPHLDAEILVNVQGDEPDTDPALIDQLIQALQAESELAVATAGADYPADEDLSNPNRVKVVTDLSGRALYFSRAAIPHTKLGAQRTKDWPLLHLGIYAWRRAALKRFLALPQSQLEVIESLEQLRLLENGIPVKVVRTRHCPTGIDTPEDFENFVRRGRGASTDTSG